MHNPIALLTALHWPSRRQPTAALHALRRALAAAALVCCGGLALAGAPAMVPLSVHGARDGNVPAWTLTATAPVGWTADCCLYARAIGVNFVLYRGEWSGKPQRVMVLNVWPRKLATLADEVAADRARYLQLDPAGKVTSFVVRQRSMACTASVYQGSDRIDDVLVFCDPGGASGIRLSWSMSLDAAEPARRALLDDFMRVVVSTRHAPTGRPGAARASLAPARPAAAG